MHRFDLIPARQVSSLPILKKKESLVFPSSDALLFCLTSDEEELNPPDDPVAASWTVHGCHSRRPILTTDPAGKTD